ncbi:MAG: undecaprenyl-phosphate glucose phosphotransferase, partial [Bacillota bacterium]
RYITALQLVLDVVQIYLAYYLAGEIWLGMIKIIPNMAKIPSFNSIQSFAAISYTVAMVFLLSVFGDYTWKNSASVAAHIKNIVKSNLILSILGVGLLFLFRLVDFSRGMLLLFVVMNTVFLVFKRILFQRIAAIQPKLLRAKRNVIVIGSGGLARQYEADVAQHGQGRISILGYVGKKNDTIGLPYLGGFSQLELCLPSPDADEVVAALETDEVDMIKYIIDVCEKNGTKISVIPYFNNHIPARPELYSIGNTKLINLRAIPLDNIGFAFLKRMTDVILCIVFLALLSPVMLFAWLGIRLTSPGPAIYKQNRVGKYKRLFLMYKFRSMHENDTQDTAWSTDADPRKTRFGSLLRKFSIDELPQLFNVLRGDMSLVGPRPEIPFYVEQFKESISMYMIKHQVRPGMTGWAQINGYRGNTSIAKRLEYDIWYIENWTFGLDIKILFITVFKGWINREQVNLPKKR